MSQMFGVPPTSMYPQQQQPGPGYYGQQMHSPLGTLAAYKGDLIYPVFTIGFFLVGVVVVVKVLLSLVALLGAKLFHGFIPRSIDDLLTGNRKRRSIDEVDDTPLDQAKLDGLTAVVMAALDSQQCQQRMICELGSFVQKYDSVHLIAGLAERLVPENYVEQVRAFQNTGQCDDYKCGQSSSTVASTSPEVKPEASSSKDVESL
ncbi:uncharacterized protein LOC124190425 [Daphnia pulex]|uniref:uncharacterized protein LOC124190425 n=1 Tax=Daphnia pulex TaxID=6669 RepID=UPI001EDE3DFF|nr:uncharacterized protein LOC124190425 [Daphnia pulex]